MTGVRLEKNGEKLRAVATNGGILAWAEAEAPALPDFEAFTVYGAIAKTFMQKPVEGKITVSQALDDKGSPNEYQISSGTKELRYKNLGDFPNYRRVIPESFSHSFIVSKSGFLSAVETADFDEDERIRLSIGKNELSVQQTQKIPCDYSGGEIVAAFDRRRLLKILGSMDSEKVAVKFNGSEMPFLFAPESEENSAHWIIAVPMRLD